MAIDGGVKCLGLRTNHGTSNLQWALALPKVFEVQGQLAAGREWIVGTIVI